MIGGLFQEICCPFVVRWIFSGEIEIRNSKNVLCISQLGCDFRVVPSHIIDINEYMLIFINKLTEITKIPEKVNFRNFSGNTGYFSPEPSRHSSERSKQ